MKVIRTFVAVLIAEDLKQRIAEVQGEVKKLAPDVKWVAPENLHVTLKFLGDVREDEIAGVSAAVEDAVRGYLDFRAVGVGTGSISKPCQGKSCLGGHSNGAEKLDGVGVGGG